MLRRIIQVPPDCHEPPQIKEPASFRCCTGFGTRPGITALLLFLFALLYLAPVWLSLSQDDEGLFVEVLTTVFHARALREWCYPFWNHLLALGAPHPLSQSLIYHPFLLLSAFFPVGPSLVIIYLFHLWLGMFALQQLCKLLKINPGATFLGVFTYALSSPTINYFVVDFWPTVMVMWSLLPCLLYLLMRLLEAEENQEKLFFSLSAGLCVGLIILNGHLGAVASTFVGITFFIIACWNMSWKRLPWLLIVFLVVSLLASSKIFDIYLEYKRFPITDKRVQEYLPLDFWTMWLWPLKPPWVADLNWSLYLRKVYRNLVFGGPYALLACLGLFIHGNTKFNKPLAFSFLACLAFWFLPTEISEILSANFYIRDPLVLFAVLLAGLIFSQLWASRPRARRALIVLACLQVGVLTAGYAHFWWNGVREGLAYWRGKPAQSLYSVLTPNYLIKVIQERDPDATGRIALSPLAEKGMFRTVSHNHFASFPLAGQRILNSYLKGVAYQEIYPNFWKMQGQIRNSAQLVIHKPLLDVLGIRFLIAGEGEPVATGLRSVETETLSNGEKVILYVNDLAWPEAVDVDNRIRNLNPEALQGCGDAGLLCQDFSTIASLRKGALVLIKRDHCDLNLFLEPSDSKRTLLVNDLYRKDWQAESCDEKGHLAILAVFPVFGSLIGMEVPPRTEIVRLSYRPVGRMILTAVTWFTLFFIIALLVWLRRHWKFKAIQKESEQKY